MRHHHSSRYRRSYSNEKKKYRKSRSRSPYRQSHSRRKSRSRSKDHESKRYPPPTEMLYQERAQQERQQKVILAIRNNEIQYDPKAHQIFSTMTPAKQQQITEQAQSLERIHECILVRELFMSGLPEMNEGFIRQFMGKYGEIQSVEIIKNFVFVKFYRVEDASNACAEYHTINTILHSAHNSNFKIFFADHIKRWNVVSNHPSCEDRQQLVPVLYTSVKNDPQFANEQYLMGLFSRFGFVRNLEVHRNQLPGQKFYALVEYETITQALRARDRLRNQKERLGDRRSEISILIDTDKLTRLYSNVNNQLRYQRKRQLTINNSHMNTYNNNTMLPPIQPLVTNEAQDIYAMIKEMASNDPHHDHQESSDWVGFLIRKKYHKVEVDLNLLHKVPFELQSVLNVSHRGDYNDALSRTDLHMAGKLRAANSLNVQIFSNYIKYFINRRRAGVIQTMNYLVYLIPPLSELNLPYPVAHNQILALFFKSLPNEVRLP